VANPREASPIAPILLAAGASRRLGRCKALVDLGGRSVLEGLAEAAGGFGALAPLVVAGADGAAIEAALPGGCELLLNTDWAAGRTGSLALAARRRPGLDLAILPVDVPRIGWDLCRALAEAWRARGSPPTGWLAPRHRGRFGHPVLVGRDLARGLGELGPDQPLSDLRRGARPLFHVESECRAVLENLDSPRDLAAIRGALGREAGGPMESPPGEAE